jgi:hypothetical protein
VLLGVLVNILKYDRSIRRRAAMRIYETLPEPALEPLRPSMPKNLAGDRHVSIHPPAPSTEPSGT